LFELWFDTYRKKHEGLKFTFKLMWFAHTDYGTSDIIITISDVAVKCYLNWVCFQNLSDGCRWCCGGNGFQTVYRCLMKLLMLNCLKSCFFDWIVISILVVLLKVLLHFFFALKLPNVFYVSWTFEKEENLFMFLLAYSKSERNAREK
jgi:hypothetical protein